jgi:hypothetical protein
VHFDFVRDQVEACAVAGETGSFDEYPFPHAARARRNGYHFHSPVGLNLLFLTAALTIGTGHGLGARLGTVAAAGFATLRAGGVDDALSPFGGLVQSQPEFIVKIRSLWLSAGSSRRTPKQVAKNAAEIAEAAAEEIAESKVAE